MREVEGRRLSSADVWVPALYKSERVPAEEDQCSATVPVLQYRYSRGMAPNRLVSGLFFIFGLAFTFSLIYSGERLDGDLLPDLTQTCLGCICEATSNCNLTIGCIGRLCGPFLISKAYWVDAGSPILFGDNPWRPGAYEACVNDPYCAAHTLKQYVSRYAQDCNRNRILDCDDYARIHYLGGHQCYLPIHRYGYYRVFTNCLATVQILN